MVTLSALDRKLFRDLWAMKGQAVSIGMVLAAGITMFVTYHSNFDSLRRTQDAYYDRYRFAHVFAACKRAPLRLEPRLLELPGVSSAELRVSAEVTLDVPGFADPVKGRLIGVLAGEPARLNEVFLRRGRRLEPGRPDEILLAENFALAHHLQPGSHLAAIINGRRRRLQVVGIVLSPEYVYTIPPGELIPDDQRFGVAWMERKALAAAYDMEGGFNDVSLKLVPGAAPEAAMAGLDRLLEPYGGLGAIPRRLQISHWTLDNELRQLQTFGVMVPVIFLGVAAFLLNVSLARALAIQRPQIASLKALGYTHAEIGWHYIKWALVIAALGGLLGIVAGAQLGKGMIALYNQYFRFPELMYRLSGGVAVQGFLVGLVAAALGAVFAVRRAVRVPPAEAMRPEPPASHRRSAFETPRVQRRLGHATRMVLRNLERQPVRALSSVLGISFAVGILLFGFAFLDAMNHLAELQFAQVLRQDVTVTFAQPLSTRAFHELRSLPGVLYAEPFRTVPARLRHGHRVRNLALTGQVKTPTLSRIFDSSGRQHELPEEGLLLSKILGEVLDLEVGDRVQVEVLEGRRKVVQTRVGALVDDFMGVGATMEIGQLTRLVREPGISGAHLLADSARLPELYARLKATPAVAGVAIIAAAREAFRKVMAQNFEIITVFNVGFAVIIAVGVVYNSARVSLSERTRELASLRVLGFTIAEISMILLGELALLTAASVLPGLLVGWALCLIVLSSLQSEVYRIPLVITPQNVAWSILTVLAAAALSAILVRRRLDHLDLVAVLKTRE